MRSVELPRGASNRPPVLFSTCLLPFFSSSILANLLTSKILSPTSRLFSSLSALAAADVVVVLTCYQPDAAIRLPKFEV